MFLLNLLNLFELMKQLFLDVLFTDFIVCVHVLKV